MSLAPKIFTIKNGQLTAKQQNINATPQKQLPRVIKYNHCVRASPDEYHTQIIKELRKENQQLKIKYRDLYKAYLGAMGYYKQKMENSRTIATPIQQIFQDGFINSVQICESISKQSQANVSSFQLDQIMREAEQSRKKINRLSQSILEQENQIEEFRQRIQEQEQQQQSSKTKDHQSQSSYDTQRRKVKTQNDQNIEDLLIQAFKQVQELKQLLQEVKSSSSAQIQQIKAQYEKKIQHLESLLQKQRKQSRMLNGVINRMRQQLQSKQNFFRAVKEVRSGPEKVLIERLLKQHRVSQ